MPIQKTLANLVDWLLRVAHQLAWLPPLLARITVGVIFLQTGWGKLHNLDQVTQFFTELHIPAPAFQARLVATTEFVGGSLLLVGLFSRLAALPLAFSMVIAILTAKKAEIQGIASILGFEEWLYIVLLVWIAIAGPGAVSLDALVSRLWRRTPSSEPALAPRDRSVASSS